MLQHTFLFLPGISTKKEQQLWASGITTWSAFLQASSVLGISDARKARYDRLLTLAKRALDEGDVAYFSLLPLKEHWRLYGSFSSALYVDIEVSHVQKDLLVVGCYDSFSVKTLVKDLHDFSALAPLFRQAQLLVTYNGAVFDLPFLRKRLSLPQRPCFDLRTGCRRLGLTGGLKEIERALGIQRDDPLVQGMQGGDPAQLYRMWKGSGDRHYLDLLVAYNEEDVVTLQRLAQLVFRQLKQRCFDLMV